MSAFSPFPGFPQLMPTAASPSVSPSQFRRLLGMKFAGAAPPAPPLPASGSPLSGSPPSGPPPSLVGLPPVPATPASERLLPHSHPPRCRPIPRRQRDFGFRRRFPRHHCSQQKEAPSQDQLSARSPRDSFSCSSFPRRRAHGLMVSETIIILRGQMLRQSRFRGSIPRLDLLTLSLFSIY